MFNLFFKKFRHRLHLKKRYRDGTFQHLTPVFVLSPARCGSSLLIDCFRSLGSIKVPGEILNPWTHIGPYRVTINKNSVYGHIVRSISVPDASISVAKLLFEHTSLYNIRIEEIKQILPNSKFIIIYRSNISEQFVSYEKSQKTNQWNIKSGENPKNINIEVQKKELSDYQNTILYYYNKYLSEAIATKSEHIVINYENFAQKTQDTFDRLIFPFLDVNRQTVSSTFVKKEKKPLSEVVSNFDEVSDLLKSKVYYSENGFYIQ